MLKAVVLMSALFVASCVPSYAETPSKELSYECNTHNLEGAKASIEFHKAILYSKSAEIDKQLFADATKSILYLTDFVDTCEAQLEPEEIANN